MKKNKAEKELPTYMLMLEGALREERSDMCDGGSTGKLVLCSRMSITFSVAYYHVLL